MDKVDKIVMYRGENFTDPVSIQVSDMSNITYTSARSEPHEVVVDDTTFVWQDVSGYSGSMSGEFSEPIVEYRAASGGVPEQNPDWHGVKFYIKPNMYISFSLYTSGNDVHYGAEIYVKTTRICILSGVTPIASQPSLAFRVGYFKERTDSSTQPSGDISIGVFLMKDYYPTTHMGTHETRWVSENYWDGSFMPLPVTPSHAKNTTPNGFSGGRADYSMPHEPGNAYQGLSIVKPTGNGLHVYRIPGEFYSQLCGELWAESLLEMLAQKIKNRIYKPTSGLLALHKLPIQSTSVTRVDGVNICGTRYMKGLQVEAVNNDGQLVCYPPSDDTWKVDLRDLEEWTNSFLDCDPYVSAMIVLPFIGTVNVDINKFVYGIIGVRYVIDVINGNCIAEIYSEDLDGKRLLMGRHAGNCAYTYPITSNDGGGFPILGAIKTAATVGLAVGASIQTAGASAALADAQAGVTAAAAEAATKSESRRLALEGLANAQSAGAIATDSTAKMNARKDAINGAAMGAKSLTSPHNLSMAGTLPNNASALAGDLGVWLYLVYKNDLTVLDEHGDDMLGKFVGRESSFWCKMGSLSSSSFVSGLFHADNVPKATDTEKAEIEKLISEGVYWNGQNN